MILFYGLLPLAGAIIKRRKWAKFRKRVNELRFSPVLDYAEYRKIEDGSGKDQGGCFCHFTGYFESVTGDHTLWIRSNNVTVPVSLKNAKAYILPTENNDTETVPEAQKPEPGKGSVPEIRFLLSWQSEPEELGQKSTGAPGYPLDKMEPGEETLEIVKWNKISPIIGKAKVFVGGSLANMDGHPVFVSTKETPLTIVIFYGSDYSLPARAISAGRPHEEYWNALTPYSLIAGALSLIVIAGLFLYRPAFRLTVMISLIATFIPLYPLIPPGLLFTVVFRRLIWKARTLNACGDLVRLRMEDDSYPAEYFSLETKAKQRPEASSRRYRIKAHMLEMLSWIIMLAGIGLNVFFLGIVLAIL